MDANFWIQRWARNEIGFHQARVNAHLERHWSQVAPAGDSSVFVPLCGKSRDMLWLRGRGHPIVGVEIARTAVADFFSESGFEAQIDTEGSFERWRGGGMTLLCGNFFDLRREHLADVGAVFDRAALIALPPEERVAYVRKLQEVLPECTPILLIVADYPAHEMQGPPFAMSDREVRELFAGQRIAQLASVDILHAAENARFREHGLSSLIERVYRID